MGTPMSGVFNGNPNVRWESDGDPDLRGESDGDPDVRGSLMGTLM